MCSLCVAIYPDKIIIHRQSGDKIMTQKSGDQIKRLLMLLKKINNR